MTNVQKQHELFTITTDNNQSFQAKTVIVTTGKGSFEPRKIQIDGVESLIGQGVHYFVTNKQDFVDHDVVIAGGGDSAVDMATMLNEVTASTRIIHRRDTFRAMEQSVNALNNSTVIKETPKKIVSVNKQVDGKLAITLAHVKAPDDITVLSVDDLIINYGFLSKIKRYNLGIFNPHMMAKFLVLISNYKRVLMVCLLLGMLVTILGKQT